MRLRWHSKPGGILEGLKVKEGAEFNIDSEDDLPHVAPADFVISDARGKSSGEFTLFLRTSRESKFATGADGRGMMNWLELVLDAIETPQSDPERIDYRLTAHREDGTALTKEGSPLDLLDSEFTATSKLGGVSDLSFTYEITLSMSFVAGRRANRRSAPVTPDMYRA